MNFFWRRLIPQCTFNICRDVYLWEYVAAMHTAPVICVNCAALSDRGTLSNFQLSECLNVSVCSSVNGSSLLELHSDRRIKPFFSSSFILLIEPYYLILLPTGSLSDNASVTLLCLTIAPSKMQALSHRLLYIWMYLNKMTSVFSFLSEYGYTVAK